MRNLGEKTEEKTGENWRKLRNLGENWENWETWGEN
jgi:hypothetical protein